MFKKSQLALEGRVVQGRALLDKYEREKGDRSTTYQRILVPLDGSELAEGILPIVERFAAGFHARVELLRIIEADVLAAVANPPRVEPLRIIDADIVAAVANPRAGRYVDELAATARVISDDHLRKVASRLSLAKGQVSVTTRVAEVAEGILQEAESESETLIAMSTHGRSGLGRFLLGSVADKVLHATTAPLLLYRPRPDEDGLASKTFKTVIVPLDGSELAEGILPHVQALAKALDLEVLLTRVLPRVTDYDLHNGIPASPYQLVPELEREAEDYLAAKVGGLVNGGLKKVSFRRLCGTAATEIVELVRETPGSFVALTTHGRTGIGRWVLGSVADRVVAYAGAPVFITRM